MAWGTYMLRNSVVLVFIRFWVRARRHDYMPPFYSTAHHTHKKWKFLYDELSSLCTQL
jgi:hypothetical protein